MPKNQKLQKFAALYESGNINELEKLTNNVLESCRKNSDLQSVALYYAAILLSIRGDIDQARSRFWEAVRIRTCPVEIRLAVAQRAWEGQSFDLVVEALSPIVQLAPRASPSIFINLAIAHDRLGEVNNAISTLRKCLKIFPYCPEALEELGALLAKVGDFEAAVNIYTKWLHSDANRNFDARLNLAVVLQKLGDFYGALQHTETLLKSSASSAPDVRVLVVHLQSLLRLGRLVEAESMVKRFGHLGNSDALFCVVKAQLYESLLYDRQEILLIYRSALSLAPDSLPVVSSYGSFLYRNGDVESGLRVARRAVELGPEDYEALVSYANILQDEKEYSNAMEIYRHLIEVFGFRPYFGIAAISCANSLGLFDLAGKMSDSLKEIFRTNDLRESLHPFGLLSIVDEQELFFNLASSFCNRIFGNVSPVNVGNLSKFVGTPSDGSINVGFFSSDFREHPVGIIFLYVLGLLDRKKFNIFCFDFSTAPPDKYTKKIDDLCYERIDCAGKGISSLKALPQTQCLAIAIDLGGHTLNSPLKYFATRLAPIQVEYLGFANTTGASFMDFIIFDRYTSNVDGSQLKTSEEVLELSEPIIPLKPFIDDKAICDSLSLDTQTSPDNFIFLATHTHKKFNQHLIKVWVKILNEVSNGVLWLSSFGYDYENNFRKCWSYVGGSCGQLVFLQRKTSRDEHLARLRGGHLLLDSFPYCSHSTACEILGQNVPILCRLQHTTHGRISASVVESLGLSRDLIANSEDDYVSLAVRYATHWDDYRKIRRHLSQKLLEVQRTADTYGASLGEALQRAAQLRRPTL